MRFKFIINAALRIFRIRTSDTVRIFLASTIVGLGTVLSVIAYFAVENELESLSENFNLTVVFDPYAEEEKINNFLISISNTGFVDDIERISPEQAAKDFIKEFDLQGTNLIFEREFPGTATLHINRESQNSLAFSKLLDRIGKYELVKDVLFRDDFINSVFELNDRASSIMLVALFFVLSVLTYIIFNTIKHTFNNYHDDLKIYYSLGAGKIFSMMPQVIYIFFSALAGIAFGMCLVIILWSLGSEKFAWLNIDISAVFIIGFIISVIFEYLMVFITALISSRARLD